MNVNAVRGELAAKLTAAGYNAFAFVPEDAKQFPAAIVGAPRLLQYGFSQGLDKVTLVVTVAVMANSYEDAQLRLDAAVSTGGVTGSVYDALKSAAGSENIAAVDVTGADNVRLVESGNTKALAIDVTVELLSRRANP